MARIMASCKVGLLFVVITALFIGTIAQPQGWPPSTPETTTMSAPSGDPNVTPTGGACGVACPPGPPGPAGRDGRDGRDAVPSCYGPTGADPTTTTPTPTTTPTAPTTTASVLYTRWGHAACPSSTQLVYSGIMAGSHYSHKGSGANYLCLPTVPIYGYANSVSSTRAQIYSAEYQTSGWGTYSGKNDHSPPCAVCLKQSKSSVLMMPARNVCPPGDWTREYKGYLMSGRQDEGKTEFICMDEAMQVLAGTSTNVNGAAIYPVVGRCLTGGGIPCGPYIDAYELTCAVCTI